MIIPAETHLVVVDDDETLAGLVQEALQQKGFPVDVFHDGPPFMRHVEKHGLPHLVILDLILPHSHGFDISKFLQARGMVPIIFISTEGEPETVIEGIKTYADDYLVKPFNITELVVRVQRVLSRVSDFGYAQSPLIQIDPWLGIDFANAQLHFADQTSVALTPTESKLLQTLYSRAGMIVPSSVLLSRVWPFEEVYEDTLRVHMHRLRRKLEPTGTGKPHYIQTVRGTGYSFIVTSSPAEKPSRSSTPR